jgi:hypothetical protein
MGEESFVSPVDHDGDGLPKEWHGIASSPLRHRNARLDDRYRDGQDSVHRVLTRRRLRARCSQPPQVSEGPTSWLKADRKRSP